MQGGDRGRPPPPAGTASEVGRRQTHHVLGRLAAGEAASQAEVKAALPADTSEAGQRSEVKSQRSEVRSLVDLWSGDRRWVWGVYR